MRIGPHRSGLRALAPLVVAGTLALTTTAVTGYAPGQPSEIPDAAFHTVTVPSVAPGAFGAPGRSAVPGASGAPERSAEPEILLDLAFETPPPGRAQPSLAPADPIVVSIAPTAPPTSNAISGAASWYCRAGVSICTAGYPDGSGFDAYAAAGPRLRAALGDWRGRIVYVDGVRVKLVDWCQCYKGEPNEKLLDLYYDVFSRTGSPVTIRW